MNQVCVIFCLLLFIAEASSNDISLLRRTRAGPQTKVVSFTFCETSLPPEDIMAKETLEEVHTYAELKNDLKVSLPDTFTICSTIMISGCQSYEWPSFFHITDNNGGPFLRTSVRLGKFIGMLSFQTRAGVLTVKIPPFFPNQWIRSCTAVNTTSGLIQWVVDGSLVLDKVFLEMKNPMDGPGDLNRMLVLGAKLYGGTWWATAQKVTNLDIFSSAFSIKKMKSMTKGASCAEEGDYLAWREMDCDHLCHHLL